MSKNKEKMGGPASPGPIAYFTTYQSQATLPDTTFA